MKGTLTLIPTPINSEVHLDQSAVNILSEAYDNGALILVEEHKVARRRWIKEGLPREAIDKFELYNEHSFDTCGELAVKALKSGRNVMLMSDCGLPAFCDPGRKLVDRCHREKITVTSAPFANSISLALALSGFNHDRFIFEGFIAIKKSERSKELKRILSQKVTSIVMDTPYRMERLLTEVNNINPEQEIFLAMNLNSADEQLLRGAVSKVKEQVKIQKSEFILILGQSQ